MYLTMSCPFRKEAEEIATGRERAIDSITDGLSVRRLLEHIIDLPGH